MKSRTSFSKLAILRKDITRYAPIWAIYTVVLFLGFTEGLVGGAYDRVGHSMGSMVASFSVVNLVYAGLCAVVIFGDLFNTRMCYSLHAMPQRRETWFLSHTGAALAFSLVPNLLAVLVMMLRLENYWFLALYWLLGVTIQFIFYFGLAALSAMLTGNRFAMLLVYAGLNFVSLLAFWIVDTIYLPQMYGVVLISAPFILLCPTVKLVSQFEYFAFTSERVWNPQFNDYERFYRYDGLADGWGYTAILLGIGIVLLGLAVVLYRLRQLESAGDFIAFRRLKGAACVIITLCFAGAVACVGEFFASGYVLWLFVGLVVGFFGSLMLLERRVRVFRLKTFGAFGILAAVLVASFLMVVYDVFGVVNWTPKAERVKSVTLANYVADSYSSKGMDMYYGSRMAVKLTEQEDIEEIIRAHEDILDRVGEYSKERHTVVLLYELENGRTVQRQYQAPASGENYEIVREFLYTPEQILGYTDWEDYVNRVNTLYLCRNEFGQEYASLLMEAVREDVRAGAIQPDSMKYEEHLFWMEIVIRQEDYSILHKSLAVSKEATHLLQVLKDPKLILGNSDMEQLESCYFNGHEILGEHRQGLLEALKKDVEAGNISLLDSENGGLYGVELNWLDSDGGKVYRLLQPTPEAAYTMAWAQENKDLWGDDDGV